MTPNAEIIIIASIVSMACALPGVFLILRKMSMMSDAISHSILLGIVIAFFTIRSLSSPLLLIGAALMGLVTVSLTEALVKTKRVKKDTSIGLVFPLLFSIAVILISKFASNVHLDTDSVILGELAFAPFDRFYLHGADLGPQSMWIMGTILIVNIIFVMVLYKELKIATFDEGLAASLGFMPAAIHYGLMGIVSVTAVGAFETVGSILVVALMVAPPATAYMFTKKLQTMIWLSLAIGVVSAITGYYAAILLDASIAGAMATMTGIFFMLALFFAPGTGIIAKQMLHRKQKTIFGSHMLAIHLLNHEGTKMEKTENTIDHSTRHLRWKSKFANKVIRHSIKTKILVKNKNRLYLTATGREKATEIMTNI